MFTVYVLKSLKNNKTYTGHTSKNPEVRLEEHNRGCNKFTRSNKPFELIYTESKDDKTEAIKRERFLKSGVGRKFIKDLTDS